MVREPAQTRPPTFTSQEVSAIFHRTVTPSSLQNLDRKGLLRPSFYYDASAPGGLISQQQRDLLIAQAGPSHGDPHRRYTYIDLVWIRLFVKVSAALRHANVPKAAMRAAAVIATVKGKAGDTCPPAWQLVVLGRELYLVREDTAESLTQPGQLGFVQLFETVEAEVRGRVSALAAHKKIRTVTADAEPFASDATQTRRSVGI